MTPAERAKAVFDAYAGLKAGELPADPMSALQVRLHRWQITQYEGGTFDDLVHGVMEEWLTERHEATTQEESDDAIADTCIFLHQVCTYWRLDFGVLYREALRGTPGEYPGEESYIACGRLAEVARKTRQKFRGGWSDERAREQVAGAVVDLLRVAMLLVHAGGSTLEEVVAATAEEVMKRRSA